MFSARGHGRLGMRLTYASMFLEVNFQLIGGKEKERVAQRVRRGEKKLERRGERGEKRVGNGVRVNAPSSPLRVVSR